MVDASLALVQGMCERILEGQRRHDQEFHDIKIRLGSIERAMGGLKRDDADGIETDAHLQHQIDQVGERVARIERRLDLKDA